MSGVMRAAEALEAALKDLLGIFGEEGTTHEVVSSLSERCSDLTTQLVTATTSCTKEELEEAAPALRRAQRLNVIASGVVKGQRDTAGSSIAGAQQARRSFGSDAPVSDGTSCDVQA